MTDPRFDPLLQSISEAALLGEPAEKLVARLGSAANRIGLPVFRLHISMSQLHPLFESYSRTWYRDSVAEEAEHLWGSRYADYFQASPLHHFLNVELPNQIADLPSGGTNAFFNPWTRYRLAAGEGLDRFPVLREFRQAGATDYVLLASAFLDDPSPDEEIEFSRRGALVSWCCDRAGGYSDSDVALIRALQMPLAVALRSTMQRRVGDVLLATYLGPESGQRVLEGGVRRADAETIGAAILLADLRGFTNLAEQLPATELVGLLDRYLAAVADPVAAAGGDVLKFLGDGLLAVFRPNDPEGCRRALTAARLARTGVETINRRRSAEGLPVLKLDQAIHAGDVVYGNVGSHTRLDFTVIGPAVNVASRLETLCGRDIDGDLLVSGTVAAILGMEAELTPVGTHSLRGVATPQTVWKG